MLLSAHRLFGVAPERCLPRILEDSRRWQGRVSERLAEQVLEAAGAPARWPSRTLHVEMETAC